MAVKLDVTRDAELIKKLGVSAEVKPKRNKFRSRVIHAEGIRWDSEHEYFCYLELKSLLKAGVITNLELQKRIPLMVGDQKIGTYVADFVIEVPESSDWFIIDAKSEITAKTQSWRRTVKHIKGQYGKQIYMAMKGKLNCQEIVVQIKNSLIHLDPAATKPITR